jgi:hypothetical protein
VSYLPNGQSRKLGWFKAARLYWQDHKGRVLTAIGLSAYAPFAIVNDVAAPFMMLLPLLDDLEVPVAGVMVLKVLFDINKYRQPAPIQHVVHHFEQPPKQQPRVITGSIVEYPHTHPRGKPGQR